MAASKFTSVKGMPDILPPETTLWQNIESTARLIFGTYGYHEIRTPIIERTELFRRGVGETTSIVEKEMYSFVDQSEESLTLRPEGTASVVRAYVNAGAYVSEPIARYYYMGPMFRRERPQKGRQRQFHQIGCELIGVESPLADAEIITMTAHFFVELGLDDAALEINSIGCKKCRPTFNQTLLEYLNVRETNLCEECRRRISRNPMRVFDCKNEKCQELLKSAPYMLDHLCDNCRKHFDEVKNALDLAGTKYKVNERIVRGLDYYMRTAFEFTSGKLGAQNAIAGGGRYDGLVKSLGGPDIAGVGFALGLERLVMLLSDKHALQKKEDIVFFAVLGERARDAVLPIIQVLRHDGVCVEWDYAARSLKSQMRRAAKIGAESVVIVGDDEIIKERAIVRDMREGTQREVHIKDLPMHFVQIGG